MLVLSRKVGERVLIGGSVVVTIVAAQGRSVRLGVEAPRTVEVLREELAAGAKGPEARPGAAGGEHEGRAREVSLDGRRSRA
ncbi:carbon storage regulator [Tautonia sociabilis]|uniref:Translational regulator CsrA n=1 Tax=Tautonia sociabilis TaxID=2080755 RepID=A0A432MKK3_9BACT|nr:carbon storage regulator [Tautonia sociabilis]RUL87954.1 carbon storage regulator [Tautonia sociabilis]